MKNTLMAATVLFIASNASAGGGHFHPKQFAKCSGDCTAEQIKAAVPASVPYLTQWGKIEASWSKATIESVEKKQFSKGPEWVATLVDGKEKRYVFMTMNGYVTGANSTGN